MSDIIKNCKVHGDLTEQDVYRSSNRVFCKKCHNLATKNWRERNINKVKDNYILNKERNITRATEWNRENKIRRAEICKKNYNKYPNKELNRRQKYYKANRDSLIDKKLIKYYENPDYDFMLRLKKYGLTVEDYLIKAKMQNFLCEICYNPEVSHNKVNNKLRRLSVDHNHHTGQIRGLLCSNCNMTLGRMKEDIERLQSMINYLKKYIKINLSDQT